MRPGSPRHAVYVQDLGVIPSVLTAAELRPQKPSFQNRRGEEGGAPVVIRAIRPGEAEKRGLTDPTRWREGEASQSESRRGRHVLLCHPAVCSARKSLIGESLSVPAEFPQGAQSGPSDKGSVRHGPRPAMNLLFTGLPEIPLL